MAPRRLPHSGSVETLAATLSVDVVVVSFNSGKTLRRCVEPMARIPGVRVKVVDNASSDRCLDTVADLPVDLLPQPDNRGFAHGCNVGMRDGRSDMVLLLNPDASLDEASLRRLAAVLDGDDRVAAVAPQIREADGTLDYSLRRFPRPSSSYARALFLHRLRPGAKWTDEVIRDVATYEAACSPDWVSGACVLVRRTVLEQIGGLDEGFFLYSEDTDLCRRIRDADLDLRYEPEAFAVHAGGASAPRASLLPMLAASRVRYARKHGGRPAALLERGAAVVESALRSLVSRGGSSTRMGHIRTLAFGLGLRRAAP